MIFEWDEQKRAINIRKHGIDFEGYTITIDDPGDYGEARLISTGMVRQHVMVVIHTERKDNIRIISARKATKNEQRSYFAQIPDGLESA
ncbi:MAG: BrnT family toxin [Magnetococcales bacterium]|nr:BrnT family toxin [Magnetococcales bacterium]MBF0151266.1 BrnT family toxin [Magnetococcales bacterium]